MPPVSFLCMGGSKGQDTPKPLERRAVSKRLGGFYRLASEGKVFGAPVVTCYPLLWFRGAWGGEEGAQRTKEPFESWLCFLRGKFLAPTSVRPGSVTHTVTFPLRSTPQFECVRVLFSSHRAAFSHEVFFILDQRYANLLIIPSVSTESLHSQAP